MRFGHRKEGQDFSYIHIRIVQRYESKSSLGPRCGFRKTKFRHQKYEGSIRLFGINSAHLYRIFKFKSRYLKFTNDNITGRVLAGCCQRGIGRDVARGIEDRANLLTGRIGFGLSISISRSQWKEMWKTRFEKSPEASLPCPSCQSTDVLHFAANITHVVEMIGVGIVRLETGGGTE